ncbi:hypothetical protein LSAT2_031691, partial [Lamellibrachia satsuma]
MKDMVDPTLRDQQAGFRQNRSCLDQIATLRIIVEQSLEWNSSLYVNFVDYEKAFDSVDRKTLWKLLRHYGVPTKLLEDLDFADDLALLSHSHQQMQDKTTELATVSLQVGLNIHKGKTKVLRMNAASTDPV